MPNTCILWISESCITRIVEETAKKSPLETGGLLIGYWADDTQAVVTGIVGPGANAVHQLSGFKPDADFHEREVSRLYFASGRQDVYLGDWHSHPLGSAAMSSIDRKTLVEISNYEPSRLPTPLMLIYGGKDKCLNAWRYRPRFLSRFIFSLGIQICELRIYD